MPCAVKSSFKTSLRISLQRSLRQTRIPPQKKNGCQASNLWCGVARNGAALLGMVRRCSAWCGVARYGAALLGNGEALLGMVRRCSVWCGVARYGAALLGMVRRCSVDRASACCKASPSSILGSAPHGGSFPLSFKAMKRWRETSANGDGQMYCMNVIK